MAHTPNQQDLTQDQLLTEDQVAARWSISKKTLQNNRSRGVGLRFVKLGERSVRYRLSDVIAFEVAHAATSTRG